MTTMRGAGGRRVRIAHLTTVDMSLALLLGTELAVDVEAGADVFGVSAPGPYAARLQELRVTHVPVASLTRRWDLRADLRAVRELTAVLETMRPDVLHTHTPKAGVFGRIAGRLVGVPVVVNTCHGLWLRPGDSMARRMLVYVSEATAARFSDVEMFQNAEDARALRWALARRDVRVVGNGVDLTRFRFDADGRARVRAELGIRTDELLVGGVGRRTAEKGLRELSAAAVALKGKARFCWVGPADADSDEAITEALPGIEMLGERSDLPAVYSAYDVFVLPSHREGFSRSAMEAASCGRPMVLSDIRGCREIGMDSVHLLLVPPRNATRLTATLRTVLTDPGLRGRLGRAAHARAQREFDQRVVARASLQAYADVASRKGLGWTLESQ